MRYALLLFLALSGCAPKNANHDLLFHGSANTFSSEEKSAFGGIDAIENSMVWVSGRVISFFDPAANGSMRRADLGTDGRSFGSVTQVLASNARFSYVMEHQGVLYNFVTRGDVYLLTSTDDGQTWTEKGVVLSRATDPASPFYQLWNVGVAVDNLGVWHLLVESAPASAGQSQVGLAYATTTLVGGMLNFDSGKTGVVVPRGGNPFIAFVPGKGLLVIHGQAYDPSGAFGGEWYTTASTFDGATWRTHKDRFQVGTVGVHVCDPHAIEVGGRILLTVSVDQNRIYKAKAIGETFASLFDRLRN